MSTSSPWVFFSLLADRNLNLGAVMLHCGPEDADALPPLLGHPDFAAVAAFSCVIAAEEAGRLPPDLLPALLDAGCLPASGDDIHRSDTAGKLALPPEAKWLSGNWYLAPPLKPSGNQIVSRAMALKLVQLVSADADTREIEEIFRHDPALSYHLLRLVNSLGMGTGKRVTSFAQAILILGRQQLRRWLNLMLFASRKDDPRSAMLLARVAVRARSAELLARAVGLDKQGQEQAFMAGMFSLLGILFGLPLEEVLKPLHISEALANAVLRREGEIGGLLRAAELAEDGKAGELAELLAGLPLSTAEFNSLNLEAHNWMLDVIRDKPGGDHA